MVTKFEKDLDYLENQVIKAEKTLEVIKKEKSVLQKLKPTLPRGFQFHDIIQQLIGSWMVLVPITHFKEILEIPLRIPMIKLYIHVLLTVFLAVMILYYSKYREIKREKVFGVPVRFISLLSISLLSTVLLMFIYVENLSEMFRTFLFLFGFSVIGSASADVIK